MNNLVKLIKKSNGTYKKITELEPLIKSGSKPSECFYDNYEIILRSVKSAIKDGKLGVVKIFFRDTETREYRQDLLMESLKFAYGLYPYYSPRIIRFILDKATQEIDPVKLFDYCYNIFHEDNSTYNDKVYVLEYILSKDSSCKIYNDRISNKKWIDPIIKANYAYKQVLRLTEQVKALEAELVEKKIE